MPRLLGFRTVHRAPGPVPAAPDPPAGARLRLRPRARAAHALCRPGQVVRCLLFPGRRSLVGAFFKLCRRLGGARKCCSASRRPSDGMAAYFVPQLGDLLYKTLFDEAEELRGMFFNLTKVRMRMRAALFGRRIECRR